MVLVTEDVGQNGKLLAFLDQAHGDTGYRRLHRHARIHQCQRGTTDRCHGAGTVGLGDLGNHTDGVREFIGARQHGGNATTGQATVADFAATGSAHATTLTDRVRREVVVQHEGVFLLAFQGVEQLRVTGSAEGRNDQGLGLATGEQCRTVGLVEHADFDVQPANGTGVATVDAWLAIDDVLANGAIFDLTEGILHFAGRRLAFFTGELGNDLVLQLTQARVAVLLDGDGVSLGDGFAELGTDGIQQRGVGLRSSPVPARLAGFGGELFDSLDHGLELVMGEQHGAQHLVFGQLFGFRLDHQYGVLGAGHDHVQAGSLELLVVRVQQVAGFRMEGHACGADRAVKRNTGNSQGGRSTDHRGDVRISLLAGGNDGTDDLHFVLETFRKQRTDRTIDQARGQGFFLGRTRLPLEEAARDLAGCVGLLLVMHGEREEPLARIGGLGTDHGYQHGDVVIDGDQHCAGGLASDTTRFQGYGRLTELKLLDYRIHGFSFSLLPWGNWQNARESARNDLQESQKLEDRS